MQATNRIEITQGRDAWQVRYIGPHALRVVSLFGTDTLPTSFTVAASAANVLAEISRLNPGCRVCIA